MLVKAWSESGPKETANSFKLLLDVFVLQKIEVCYLLLNCWCLLNELDVIVIVINRRLFVETFCLYCCFSVFCGGIKRISALTYDYFSSVVVLLLCIRPIDHAGGFMHVTDIVVSWKLGSNCIVYIETGWCCVCGFRVNSLKFICTVCLVGCKHIRNIGSLCNKFLYYSRRWHSWLRPRYETEYYCFRFERCFFQGDLAVVANVARWKD